MVYILTKLIQRNKSFNIFTQIDDQTTVKNSSYNTLFIFCTNREIFSKIKPWIISHLLYTQRNASFFLIYIKYFYFNNITLFKYFTRMIDFLCPRHIGDMDQTINSLF